jgi:CBS domain-containing protein
VAGKVDWRAHNLPVEGKEANLRTAGRLLRLDVATCGLQDRIGEVRERILATGYGFGLVVTAEGVLLGRLRRSELDCDPHLRAEEVMEAGPSTVRPDKTPDAVAKRLDERGLRWAIVTNPEGRLLGIVNRDDLDRA